MSDVSELLLAIMLLQQSTGHSAHWVCVDSLWSSLFGSILLLLSNSVNYLLHYRSEMSDIYEWILLC